MVYPARGERNNSSEMGFTMYYLS